MDHQTIARKGGLATMKKYGREHYSLMGKRGGESKLAKYGPDYFKNLSRMGVIARLKKLAEKSAVEQSNNTP